MRWAVAVSACVVLFVILGCTTQKEWEPLGGSRADGTVEMAYEYGMFEKPQVNEQQGAQIAGAKCAAWGYTMAQPFGAGMRKCQQFNQYGNCIRWLVQRQYQCMGAPDAGHAKAAANTAAAQP